MTIIQQLHDWKIGGGVDWNRFGFRAHLGQPEGPEQASSEHDRVQLKAWHMVDWWLTDAAIRIHGERALLN